MAQTKGLVVTLARWMKISLAAVVAVTFAFAIAAKVQNVNVDHTSLVPDVISLVLLMVAVIFGLEFIQAMRRRER